MCVFYHNKKEAVFKELYLLSEKRIVLPGCQIEINNH